MLQCFEYKLIHHCLLPQDPKKQALNHQVISESQHQPSWALHYKLQNIFFTQNNLLFSFSQICVACAQIVANIEGKGRT